MNITDNKFKSGSGLNDWSEPFHTPEHCYPSYFASSCSLCSQGTKGEVLSRALCCCHGRFHSHGSGYPNRIKSRVVVLCSVH